MSDEDFQKHHQPLPCKFCGKAAGYSPLPEMSIYGVDIYFCHPCQTEYVFWRSSNNSDGMASVSIYTDLNGKIYRLTFQNDETANLWYIKNPGVPGTRVNKDLEMIKSFSYHPEVTPENFNDKIRTWLVYI